MSDNPNSNVSRAGFGKQGYCKLCAFKDVAKLNKLIAAGWNARQIDDWLRENYDGMHVTRATLYKHRDDHAKHPADRLVTAVEKTQTTDVMIPQKTTSEQFLGAVQDAAMARALKSPDEITISDGLKAAQILTGQKKSGGDIVLNLAYIVTGARPLEVFEGEYVEVPE